MKAREAFAAGRYDEALNLFAKLYAETLHPVYLRNIGRCHQKLRQPEQAIDKFHEYLVKEKKISADERKEIDGYIKEMEALRDEQAQQKAPPPPVVSPPPVTPHQSAAAADELQLLRRRRRRRRRRSATLVVAAAAAAGGSPDLQEVVVLDRHRRGGRGRRRDRRRRAVQRGTTRPRRAPVSR